MIKGFALLLMAFALAACSSGGGNKSTPPTPPPPTPSGTVAGTAGKGLLLDAIVNFYAVTNGTAGTTSLASTRTDAQTGAFSSPVTSAGPVLVTLTTDGSTQMLDEISGAAVAAPAGLVLHTVFDSVTNLQPIAITPLTELAYQIASTSTGGLTTTNIDAANNAVSGAFLNGAGASALYTLPISLANYSTAPAAQQELAKLLTAFAVAANEGTAVGANGSPCTAAYPGNIPCMIGGLSQLLTINSSGTPTLGSAANYILAAYNSLDSGTVTIEGGKSPSAAGLSTTTAAETAFASEVAGQAAPPGFSTSGTPLANSEALVANIRTNVIDQTSTQTFGFAPVLTALQTDIQGNVIPVMDATHGVLRSVYYGTQLIAAGNAGAAPASAAYAGGGGAEALAFDAATGGLVATYDADTIQQVTLTGATSVVAGVPETLGSTNGAALQATFFKPFGIAVDSSTGNVYVADYGNNVIRLITPAGVVSTWAGSGTAAEADGQGTAASFDGPIAIASDGHGNLYVADNSSSPSAAGSVRKINAQGAVTTLVSASSGALISPFGIAVDPASGNVYVDGFGSTGIVYEIDSSATLRQLASGFTVPYGLVFDSTSGNVVVTDFSANTVSTISAGGTVTTLAGSGSPGNSNGLGTLASFNGPAAITTDGKGNFYVGDYSNASIRMITGAGATTTIQQSTAVYQFTQQGMCGWDPVDLGTANNVAVCRIAGFGGNAELLLTITQTAAGSYTLESQALTAQSVQTHTGLDANPVYSLSGGTHLAVVPTIAALPSDLTLTGSYGVTPLKLQLTGPYYVNSTGGQVQANLAFAQSSDWNFTTGSGSLSVSGTLNGGAGGIALQNATIGSDSVIALQNTTTPLKTASPPASVTGTFDLSAFNTGTYNYVLELTAGAPVLDKSGKLAVPGTVNLDGTIQQVGSGGALSPLFNGTIGVGVMGFAAFDATQPLSATNFFTGQVQIAGAVALSGGRVLDVSATVNATQEPATPAAPDSFTATYSYSTPQGTAALNASGTYDATDGLSGTVTNNAGVTIAVKYPIGGPISGTITASGTETATIGVSNGLPTVFFTDGTTQSLN